MADKKISDLPAATMVNPTDLVPIVQSGATLKATISLLPTGTGMSMDGQLLWNNGGAIDGTGQITYSPSGTILTIAAGDPADVPLAIQATGSQAGNLQEWQNSGGSGITSIDAGAHLTSDAVSAGGTGSFLIAEDGTLAAGMLVTFTSGGFTLSPPGGGSIILAPGGSGYNFLTNGVAHVSIGLPGNGGVLVQCTTDVPAFVSILAGGSTSDHVQCFVGASKVFAVGNGGEIKTNQTGSGTTLGSVVAFLPIYDATGSLVGYLPLYDSIT